jgi:hypothetical protein
VRDPVERAVAQYLLQVATAGEQRSLADALGDLSDPYSLYTCPGFYARQLERYLSIFPPEQLRVVDQAELLGNRRSTLRELFSFVGVDDQFESPDFDETLNTSDAHRTYSRFIVMSRWARGTILLRLPRSLRLAMRRTVEGVVSRPLERPELSDDLRDKLRKLYSGDVERLREMTGKTFPTWSL